MHRLHRLENYLGHSINAPVGRWQSNKDIHWYSRDATKQTDAEREAAERKEEIRRLKEAEEEALAIALGQAPKKKMEGQDGGGTGTGTGSNSVPVKRDNEMIEKAETEERRREKE